MQVEHAPEYPNKVIIYALSASTAEGTMRYLRERYDGDIAMSYTGETLVIGPVEHTPVREQVRNVVMHVAAVATAGDLDDASSHSKAATRALYTDFAEDVCNFFVGQKPAE